MRAEPRDPEGPGRAPLAAPVRHGRNRSGPREACVHEPEPRANHPVAGRDQAIAAPPRLDCESETRGCDATALRDRLDIGMPIAPTTQSLRWFQWTIVPRRFGACATARAASTPRRPPAPRSLSQPLPG